MSNENIRDTASGMRIIRRESLVNLMPLPDGLHFTPAMSARAILSDYLKISEIDMPYKEREGESKLNVLKDGVRFLNVIVTMIFMYQPQKILLPAALLCYAFGLGLLVTPPIPLYLLSQCRGVDDLPGHHWRYICDYRYTVLSQGPT